MSLQVYGDQSQSRPHPDEIAWMPQLDIPPHPKLGARTLNTQKLVLKPKHQLRAEVALEVRRSLQLPGVLLQGTPKLLKPMENPRETMALSLPLPRSSRNLIAITMIPLSIKKIRTKGLGFRV